MKQLLSLLVLALAMIAATPAQPPAQIVALTQAIVDAANTNNADALAGDYTGDAVVIDENPPFVWRGADAGVQWYSGVQQVLAANDSSLHVVVAAPSDFQMDREGDDAYLNQKAAVSVTTNGKTATEHGTQTYTFHKAEDGTWKISRQIWTTAAPQPAKSSSRIDHAAAEMMDAFNKRTPNAMAGLYTNDATFVDDLSPFVWNGPSAGSRWYAEARRYLKANGIADIHGVIGAPVESSLQGNAAYVIVPVTWSGTANGKPFTQHGTYTFTLRRTGGNWLITSQTWLASS
jgi:ketosteroid isomerase-like protein